MANKQDVIKKPATEILKDHVLLRTVEVLKVLNISRTTFYKLKHKEGFPKAIRSISRNDLWVAEEIMSWAKNAR